VGFKTLVVVGVGGDLVKLAVHCVLDEVLADRSAVCTSSAVKPSLFFVAEEVKRFCIDEPGMVSVVSERRASVVLERCGGAVRFVRMAFD
jgi:hypothetical protein